MMSLDSLPEFPGSRIPNSPMSRNEAELSITKGFSQVHMHPIEPKNYAMRGKMGLSFADVGSNGLR